MDGSVGKGTFVPGSDLDLVIITGKNMVPTRRDTARVHNSVHMKLEVRALQTRILFLVSFNSSP